MYFDAFFQTARTCLLHIYFKRQKHHFLTLSSILQKSLQFCNMPGQPNTTFFKRPALEARDDILLQQKPKVTWCIDKKKTFCSKVLQTSAPEQAKENVLYNYTDGDGDKKKSIPRQPGLSFSQILVRSQKHMQKLVGR